MALTFSRKLSDTPAVLAKRFSELRDYRDVARLLEVDAPTLGFLLYRSPPSTRYTQYQVAKRRGGHRTISAPMASLKAVQRKLNQVLQAVYTPKPSAHGFVEERSIVSNAKRHDRRRFILNVDLQDFFGTINFGRVRGMFMAKPYRLPERASTVLAQICCFDNSLPQGAPTSPVVSNMICGQLDAQLQWLARELKVRYTRYADDLTFSGTTSRVPHELGVDRREAKEFVLGSRLSSVISSNGFVVNAKKVRLATPAERQEVTGLVVNRRVNVPREYVRTVRAMLHAWSTYGLEAAQAKFDAHYDKKHRPVDARPAFSRVVRGRIEYIGAVRGKKDLLYRNMLAKYSALAAPPPAGEVVRNGYDQIREALWVLEEEEVHLVQGSAFAVMAESLPEVLADAVRSAGHEWALITCNHCLCAGLKAFRASNHRNRFDVRVIAKDDIFDVAILVLQTDRAGVLSLDANSTMEDGMPIRAAGFPNYGAGMVAPIYSGFVAGRRRWHGLDLPMLDVQIVAGMSGGPALDSAGIAVGVIVTGAEDHASAKTTEMHGAIPLSALTNLRPLATPAPP